MDYRSAYIRRSRKGSRLKKRVAAVAFAGVAGCAALFALAMGDSAPAPAVQRQAVAPAVLHTAAQVEAQEKPNKTRRVYPYSIVPGGLADRKELVHAIVMDKVVAVHYAAFEADKATVETVHKPRAVYVSYRKGDKVYWTAKKLHLAEGETLLSDGKNEIRGRCGNRISDVPQQPVEARGPSEEELDSSVAADDADAGGVQQVGMAVDGNPAGQGYPLQTFGTGGTTQGSNGATHTSATLTSVPSSGFGPIWDGGTLPVAMVSKVSSDTSDTSGSGTGTPGTGTETAPTSTGGTSSGTTIDTKDTPAPSGGTQPTTTPNDPLPPTDHGTKPLPGTLLPPTTDLPGQTNPPGKSPTKPTKVPEPGTLWLGGAGVAALLASRRAKKRTRK